MKMKEICVSERPREKMLAKGAAALSEAELLAVLLRSGTRETGVLDLANSLLMLSGGSLVGLFSMKLDELRSISGIGPEKACSLMAAWELGRRFLEEGARMPKAPVTTARRVFELMIPLMKGMDHEEFWVLLLNKSNRLIRKQKLFSGGVDSTSIDTRMVMDECIRRKAVSIVIVHNHPSGDPKPSQADIAWTRKIQHACLSFDIKMLDHVVISDESFFSLTDNRLYGGGGNGVPANGVPGSGAKTPATAPVALAAIPAPVPTTVPAAVEAVVGAPPVPVTAPLPVIAPEQ